MKRQATLLIPLRARDLRPVQPAGASDLDPLRAEPQGRLDSLLHRAAESHSALELQRDRLRHELRVGLRALDFNDVDVDFGLHPLLELVAELVHLGAALADDDARPGSLDVDLQPVGEALDVHFGHASVRQSPLQLLAQLEVLVQEGLIVLHREPARVPGAVETEPETVRVDLLSHAAPYPFTCDEPSESSIVRWLLRWRTRNARPIGAGRIRRSCGPLSTKILRMTRSSTSSCASFCSALATAERRVFKMSRAATLGVYCRIATASLTDLPRTISATSRTFWAEPFMYRSVAVAFISFFLRLGRSCHRRRRRRGGARSARRSPNSGAGRGRRRGGLCGLLAAVTLEDPGRGELAELVSDHVLRDVHGNELSPVVHRDRVTHHVGHDGRAAGPGLDDFLLPRGVQRGDLLHEVVVHESALLDRACHVSPLILGLAPAHDEPVRPLVVPGLHALGLPAPGGSRVTAAGRLSFTAPHRVVHRVHRHAAHVRAEPQPAVSSRFPDRDVLVFEVPHLADRRVALDVDLADFARGQAHLRVSPLLGHELRGRAGGAHELAAAAPLQLDVVDRRAERDALQGKSVAGQDVRRGPGHDARADLQAIGRQNVPLLAIQVVEQRDPGGAVGVVLDRGDAGRDGHFVSAEVNDPVEALVSAPHEAAGLPPLAVAAPGRAQPHRETLLGTRGRQLHEVVSRLETPPRGRRFVFLYGHIVRPPRRTRWASRQRPAARKPSSRSYAGRGTSPCASTSPDGWPGAPAPP